jgi:predicted dehydrogenase
VSVNNWVHSDLNRHVRQALQEDAVGEVQSVELRTGRPDCALGSAGWLPRWRTDLTHAGGGIILDHGWHQLYLLLGWMRAPLECVRAVTRTVDTRHLPVEDEALIDLYFPDALGRIELAWTARDRTNAGMIRGSRGTIGIFDDRVVLDNEAGMLQTPFNSRLTESSYHPDWFEVMFERNVLNSDRTEADRNFAEAGVLVSAIRAAYCSARESGAPRRPTFPTGEAVSEALTGRVDARDGDSSSGGHPPE